MPFRVLYFESIKFGTISTTDPVMSFAFPFSYAPRIIQMTNVKNVSTAGPFLLFHIICRMPHQASGTKRTKHDAIGKMKIPKMCLSRNRICLPKQQMHGNLLQNRFATKTKKIKIQKMTLARVGSSPLDNYFSAHKIMPEIKCKTWKQFGQIIWSMFSTVQDFHKMTFTSIFFLSCKLTYGGLSFEAIFHFYEIDDIIVFKFGPLNYIDRLPSLHLNHL